MPWDCGFLCLFTDRRRFCEILWRRRLLVTNDEKKAKRRFLNLMRGFDSEDLEVLRRAVESNGRDIKQCAPGPPMDLVEEEDSDEEETIFGTGTTGASEFNNSSRPRGCSTTIVSTRPRHSINRLERDRILFQRQKFPTTTHSTTTAIGPTQQSHSFRKNRRESSSGSRRFAYISPSTIDENCNVATIGIIENLDTLSSDGEDDQIPSTSRRQKYPLRSNNNSDVDTILTSPQYEDCGLIPQIDRPMSMPYLCCKMWRWKELQVDAALHTLDPLPWCRFGRVTINNATVSCCNPFHYGLWIRPEQSSTSEDQSIAGIVANGGGHLALGNTSINDTGFGDELTHGTTTTTTSTNLAAIGHVRAAFNKSVEQIYDLTDLDDVPPLTPPPPVPHEFISSSFTPNHLAPSIHSQAIAWGRMARWEKKDRIGDVVALVGQFVAIGKLAGTVFDGQDVKSQWDLDNHVSFSLIKQSDGDNYEDVWLYNSGDRPLFLCVSKTLSTTRSEAIRRLLPGYCLRVNRTPIITTNDNGDIHPSSTTMNNNDNLTSAAGLAGRPSTDINPIHQKVSFLTISVGIGWGINYQRLYVTEMPCRYEIIFT